MRSRALSLTLVALGGNNRVSGGPGCDVVCLSAGNDALNGGAGDDLFVADAGTDGADSFAGGSGTDTARYAGRTAAVAVSLNNVRDDGARDEDDNIHADVENAVGGAFFGGAHLQGRAGDDAFTTTNGTVDTVDGGVGVDSCLTDPTDITVNCGF